MYRSSVEFSGQADINGDPDIVYYNADIINDNALQQVQLGLDPVVRFQETRSTALIKDISQFYFSIVRFTMNGPNKDLPLFIPSIQLGQSDLNLTAYSVGLQLRKEVLIGGNPFTFSGYARRFVKYRTETTAYAAFNIQLPNPPIESQDIRGVYYNVYSFQHWLDLMNDTLVLTQTSADPLSPYKTTLSLQEQFQAFWTLNGGAGVAPSIISEPPTITYSDNIFTLQFDTYGYGGKDARSFGTGAAGDEEAISLWFNTNSFGLFTNLNNEYLGNELTGQVNNIIVSNHKGTNLYFPLSPTMTAGPPPTPEYTGKSYYTMTQEYESNSTLWSPVSALVFTSTLIPIFPESVGEPIVYGGANDTSSANNSTSAFSPIITDIALPLNSASDYRTFIEYVPTAEYRLSAFTSSRQELRNIDVQVFWKCRLDNNLYPVRMFNLSSVSLKMMFRKKRGGI
jgi:hypothetical protein